MKRSLIPVVLLACAAAGIAAQSQDQDQSQVGRRYRSLVETERRFAAALLHEDPAGVRRFGLHFS